MISIVIPVYNEEENVALLHEQIVQVMDGLGEQFEVIFVDDGSTDDTLVELKKLSRIKIVVLSMDFGQTSALDAGIHDAQGDIIITMDGDLQNDPRDIPKMISKIREGYDVVAGWRKNRGDSFGRRALSRLANWLTGRVTGLKLNDSACALKAFRREVIQNVRLYGEMHVFLPGYLYGHGARVAEIPVTHHERKFGVSKHYFLKAVKDISDLMTIKFLVTMSGRPLLFFGGVGMLSAFFSVVVAGVSVYLKVAGIRNFGQTPLPILVIFFALSSIIFVMLGFVAELILRVYFETNKKTPYFIRERIDT